MYNIIHTNLTKSFVTWLVGFWLICVNEAGNCMIKFMLYKDKFGMKKAYTRYRESSKMTIVSQEKEIING